ncbi:MAG TPA: sulfotransferase [Steroidobacteraceae bacterium]|nr:sulfotransferase [Steroidobacteraceae bacterium]
MSETTRAFEQLQEALSRIRAKRLAADPEGAITLLAALEQEHSGSGLLWQERAFCLRARGENEEAAAALRRAVELNDALPESWRALMSWAGAAGDGAELARATSALAKLERLPPELLEGSSRLSEGDLDGAEELIRDYLRRHGPHLDGMRLLAQASADRKSYDDAELLLEAVLDRNPDYHEARYELGKVFVQRRRFYPALLQAQKLLPLNPSDRKTRKLYASACDGLGRFDEGLRVYRELLAESPDDQESEFSIAFSLRNQGRSEEAIAGFRRLMRLPGSVGSAYAALADMKTHRFSDEDIAVMRRIEADPDLAPQHLPVCFALGKAMEDRRQYEESFRFYERGNALRRAETSYNAEALERTVGIRETLFTREFVAARRHMGCPRPDPIFIVGMPRAGSTLLEQILASHSQVDGTLELPEIPRLVKQFRPRRPEEPDRYAAVLADLSPRELRQLGEIYLEETRVYRQSAPFFVDKMPANFQEVGFIQLILPNAKIIDARRDAMACCFSNFKQLFGNGQEFSYGLRDVGHYYRNYVRLMDHWDRVLPGKVLRVRHADTVMDFEATVRRILDYCGLPFEQSCLEFYKTQRSVRTVSSEQVRRPINREGLELWRNYDPWLAPLKEALGPLAEADAGPPGT